MRDSSGVASQDATHDLIREIVQIAVENNASDIHLKSGMQPVLRIDGRLRRITTFATLESADLERVVSSLLNDLEKNRLEQNLDIDLAVVLPGLTRVRMNVYADVDSFGCAMRLIPNQVPSIEQLNLPSIVKTLAESRSGLIIVSGVTGAGKSTTLAAMLDYINRQRAEHIYTIEDPIEFIHKPVRSIVTQREIGFSSHDFPTGVKSALRADPNVLLIGEMRDPQTVKAALNAAETGLLVFSTLHTSSATKTIQRILGMFESHERESLCSQLAYALRAVICQQLVPLIEGGRKPVHELLVLTPSIQEALLAGELEKLSEYIREGKYDGMCTMDASLYDAYSAGEIEGTVMQEFALDKEEASRSLRGAHSR